MNFEGNEWGLGSQIERPENLSPGVERRRGQVVLTAEGGGFEPTFLEDFDDAFPLNDCFGFSV